MSDESLLEGVHQFLVMIRTLCDATDDEIGQSLDQLSPMTNLDAWATRWLHRQKRLPVAPPIPDGHADLKPVFGEALIVLSRKYRNCAAHRVGYPAVGKHLYYEWIHPPGPDAVVEPHALAGGKWLLHDIRSIRNTIPDAKTITAIRSKLQEHGILLPASGYRAGKFGGLSRLLHIYDWDEDDDDELAGAEEAAEAANPEVA